MDKPISFTKWFEKHTIFKIKEISSLDEAHQAYFFNMYDRYLMKWFVGGLDNEQILAMLQHFKMATFQEVAV